MTLNAMTIWLTGLPCSGKTTIARALRARLETDGVRAVLIDADELRATLNADLGFSPGERKENLRRAAHLCRFFNLNGIPVIACFLSPTGDLRAMVRQIVGDLTLVHVKCSLSECERRDVKGMYAKARAGLIDGFTGVSAPFEEPADADVTVDSEHSAVDECCEAVLKTMRTRNA